MGLINLSGNFAALAAEAARRAAAEAAKRAAEAARKAAEEAARKAAEEAARARAAADQARQKAEALPKHSPEAQEAFKGAQQASQAARQAEDRAAAAQKELEACKQTEAQVSDYAKAEAADFKAAPASEEVKSYVRDAQKLGTGDLGEAGKKMSGADDLPWAGWVKNLFAPDHAGQYTCVAHEQIRAIATHDHGMLEMLRGQLSENGQTTLNGRLLTLSPENRAQIDGDASLSGPDRQKAYLETALMEYGARQEGATFDYRSGRTTAQDGTRYQGLSQAMAAHLDDFGYTATYTTNGSIAHAADGARYAAQGAAAQGEKFDADAYMQQAQANDFTFFAETAQEAGKVPVFATTTEVGTSHMVSATLEDNGCIRVTSDDQTLDSCARVDDVVGNLADKDQGVTDTTATAVAYGGGAPAAQSSGRATPRTSPTPTASAIG